jgi:hypothetical protein
MEVIMHEEMEDRARMSGNAAADEEMGENEVYEDEVEADV